MRLVTYRSESGPRVAGVRDGGYVDLNHSRPDVPSSIKALLAQGPKALAGARAALEAGEVMPAERVRLAAPVPDPEKVICIGVNYADHARESGMEPPGEPVVFSKFSTAVCAHDDPIILPRLSEKVDYEGELVVVIGTGGRNIAKEQAQSHVAAYCCGNDVSARDWQLTKPAGQWLLGKSFDSFAPFGPALVTADEVPNPGNLKIQTRVSGLSMQDSNTDQLIFSVEELIAYISGVCTLTPGDLIFTGTPPGVGGARNPPIFLKPGDIVEVEIEHLGVLRNPVVAEQP
jgi:2-keto-4-pentenoate hydratase/2-oxohepta-3-ene-1,7-dioic acid hydratase in catechol pathway